LRGKTFELNKRLTKSLYSKEWEIFLKILKRAREERGWTQEQVAKRLGRPQSLVAKVEAGERRLDVCQFVDYMRILEADPVQAMQRLMQEIENASR
jgi:transcriptional regulator with XRE-family HTH domain